MGSSNSISSYSSNTNTFEEMLLKYGNNINEKDANGYNYLMIATNEGKIKIVMG